MSKLGKKYTFRSEDAIKTSNLYNFIQSQLKKENIQVAEITEEYDDGSNSYVGSIKLTGPIENLRILSRSEKFDALLEAGTPRIDTVFSADMHYEELVEIPNMRKNISSVNGASSAVREYSNVSSNFDVLNLYKFKANLEYNFLIKNYESLISDTTISETALPNYYKVLYSLINQNNYAGFEGTSFFESSSAIITSKFNPEMESVTVPSYYQVNSQSLQIDKFLNRFDSYKEQFPFYTEITFDTHKKDEENISDSLQQKNLLTALLNTSKNGTDSTLYFNNLGTLVTGSNSGAIIAKEANINNFLTDTLNDYFENNDFTFIFDINSKVDSKSRTFEKILKGEEEYSEVIGYRLRKYDGNGTKIIQEYFLPNVSETQYKWVDTQIKYNKLYTYKLDLMVLTFTTEYVFEKPILERNQLVINFTNRPIIKVYTMDRIPNTSNSSIGASYTNKLMDYPPIEPEVEIVPYINVSNKIKINLNTAIGKKTVLPISFSSEDENAFEEIKMAQNVLFGEQKITFQSDEPSSYFQLYRLDYKPSSYEDFFRSQIALIPTNNSSAGSFIDSINENKKYYYIARALDSHNHVSNPTPIYEVEIINDNGLILPLISVVDFDKKEELKQPIKSFKKYLKIQPALRHKLVNDAKTTTNNIELGSDSVLPWNQTFKVRITSKSTGKKIDINLRFKYNKPT